MPDERASRWDTVAVQRRILGVVRTPTSLDRLWDVFPVLADDFRVEMRFTVAGGSAFGDELAEHLRREQLPSVRWQDAGTRFDLAVSPSHNGALHELTAPLLTLPHGAGYHKHRPTEQGLASDISGLSPAQLMRDGQVVASAVGLPHHDQLALLRQSCPAAAEHAVVIGDPCYDRLRASLPSREHYRRALGTGRRKLVLLGSTWGEGSLFGRQPDLARRLTTELPPDDYQVALVLHPNIWERHSPEQVRLWTRRARAAGLLLIPPHRGWRATLVASDVVISDHGSLAFYSAALGKPLLLAEFATHEIAAGTPMAALGEHAARLRADRDRRVQIDSATPVGDHERLAAAAFAYPGKSADRLREVIYERMDLPLPSWDVHAEPVDVFTPQP